MFLEFLLNFYNYDNLYISGIPLIFVFSQSNFFNVLISSVSQCENELFINFLQKYNDFFQTI